MTNEEAYLNSKVGRRNPFTVPEGYFDQLATQVISSLPSHTEAVSPGAGPITPRRTTFKALRPWLYAAACLCVVALTAAFLFKGQGAVSKEQTANAEPTDTYYTDSYIDEEADYAMIDNQDIYAYLLADM